jgi:spermidine synthase
MTEYVEIARHESPRGEVVLRARHAASDAPPVLELRVNGVFVMDTQETSSEKALAAVALAQVREPRAVVVAGLGLGFTMHEMLNDRRVEKLAVVEIEEALVRWMRDGTVPHGPAYLADERLTVVTADIRIAMAEATPATYDLVLLDIDNGPGQLVHDDNESVYQQDFLAQTRTVLRPGGALAIWSASPSAELQATMEEVFGNAVAIPYDVTLQSRAEQYWLYLSRQPDGRPR